MAGYLIAEEGPLTGLVIKLEGGTEWTLGRDLDESSFVLEDPMVSRRHVICRLTSEGYFLENLSTVNPATQNGKIVAEPILLQEGDILQIGNTFFRFTEKDPAIADKPPTIAETDDLGALNVTSLPETRWMIKVVSGPNAGAEFHMQKGSSYTLGKDAGVCDIVFQDLSVSKQHSKISVDDDESVFIEDLGSRNGTLVNGKLAEGKQKLSSQDLISLGTTSFLAIDHSQIFDTIIAAPTDSPFSKKSSPLEEEEKVKEPINIRELVISKRHLVIASFFGLVILLSIAGILSLFRSEVIAPPAKHEQHFVEEIVTNYSGVQFFYNEGSGKLFLTGHVLTTVEQQELLYQLRGLPFLKEIENNVVIDECVWQNMNALLSTNTDFLGVSIYSSQPGYFVVRGYLQTPEQVQSLVDYLNMNFPYLDRLENAVVVENNLLTQIESLLTEKGFNNVTYQLTDGDLVLSGRVDGKDSSNFEYLVKEVKGLRGIRALKNYVVYTNEDSSLVDLSSKYKVMGFSKKDGENHYVVVNGRILSVGDHLDGMIVAAIQSHMILLEKDGLKFKINYNLQ